MPSALLIPADLEGAIELIEVKPYGPGSLEELQSLVGGNIEAVRYYGDDRVIAYINEEGKVPHLCGELFVGVNLRATSAFASGLWEGDFIAGDLVICGFNRDTGEHVDLPGDFMDRISSAGWPGQEYLDNLMGAELERLLASRFPAEAE